MDFLSDQLFNGRKIRILTIVGAFSRLSPAFDVQPYDRGPDGVKTLERVTGIHGTPKTIRLDNGQLISTVRSGQGPYLRNLRHSPPLRISTVTLLLVCKPNAVRKFTEEYTSKRSFFAGRS